MKKIIELENPTDIKKYNGIDEVPETHQSGVVTDVKIENGRQIVSIRSDADDEIRTFSLPLEQ